MVVVATCLGVKKKTQRNRRLGDDRDVKAIHKPATKEESSYY